MSRTEKGARNQNYHVPSKDREGDGNPSSATPAIVFISAILPGTFLVGSMLQVTASVLNASSIVLFGLVPDRWLSSDTSVATVDGNGLVTGVGVGGPVSITAGYAGIASNAIIISVLAPVMDITPASIAITPTSVSLVAGQTQQLTAVVKNAAGSVIAGAKPDAWHSATPAVATVSNTGLITAVGAGGPMNVTATLTSPSLTSNACAVTATASQSPTDEPVFGGAMTVRYTDDFTKYSSAHEMWLDRSDGTVRFGQTDATNTPADEDTTGILLLSPGRDGVTGKNIRFVYAGITQESHELWLRNMPTLADSTRHFFQYWARFNLSVPLNPGGAGSDLAIKWFMAFHRTTGAGAVDAGLRNQWNTHNYQPGPLPPPGVQSCMWEVIDTLDTGAHQPVAPWATDVFNAGQWFRCSHEYRPNTSVGSRDGVSRMWVNGVLIIDIRAAVIDVTPVGGWKPWCVAADVDALGTTTVDFLKIMGNLTNNPGTPFTVDWTEFIWGTTAA